MASEGHPRIELYRNEALIDTVYVHKFTSQAISDLLEEMGQKRDIRRTWKTVNAERELAAALNPNLFKPELKVPPKEK